MINPINPADKTKRAKIDWEAVERDYRIGQLTVRQIQEKHSVSNGGMMAKAKKEGWTRDLSDAVRIATKAKVRQKIVEQVKEQVEQSGAESRAKAERATFSDVDLAATANALLMGKHQARAGRLSSLLEKLTGEMEEVTADPQSLESIALALEENDPKSAEAVNRLRTLTSRFNNLKTAGEILGKLVPIERQAYGIGEDSNGSGGSIESLISEIEREEAAL